MKISGVVILYNPIIEDVISNIKTYIEPLDVLYVFDNSDNGFLNKETVITISPKVIYFSGDGNRGIAYALNFTAQIAFKSEFEWILTMDQDSSFLLPNGFKYYLNSIQKEINTENAFFSPMYPGEGTNSEQHFTSGSVMNLKAWLEIGKFDENLFIDEVDGDFTYRLSAANYKLKKIRTSNLIHNLGDKFYRKFLWKTLCSDNHTALRKYYIARNRVYLMKKRPNMRLIYFSDSLYKFILFILIETDKTNKFLMILRGIYDGITNKMGKYKKIQL